MSLRFGIAYASRQSRGECVAPTPIQYGAHPVQCYVKIWCRGFECVRCNTNGMIVVAGQTESECSSDCCAVKYSVVVNHNHSLEGQRVHKPYATETDVVTAQCEMYCDQIFHFKYCCYTGVVMHHIRRKCQCTPTWHNNYTLYGWAQRFRLNPMRVVQSVAAGKLLQVVNLL